MLAILLALAGALLASADTGICALVAEGSPAVLSCPQGQVLTSIDSATFGTFLSNSTCTGSLNPAPACPTTVLAQVRTLCTGAAACNVSCDCASLPSACGCSSTAPSLTGALLRLAFPGVPCSGVPKQLGMTATCGAALPAPAPQPAPAQSAPSNLLLEFMPSPVLGLDNLQPHFTWTPPAAAARLPPAAIQSAARVQLTTYPGGAPVWDSGAVAGSAPLLVPPQPLPLQADTRYQWTVVTADASGAWSLPSQPALLTTGLLAPSDWGGAAWIGGWRPGTLLRRDFTVTSTAPAYASISVSACQYYLLYLDGVRLGGRELDVAWTRFAAFRSYATYQLPGSLLAPGNHTLGLALGQGFCGESSGKAGNHTTQGLLRLALRSATGALLQPLLVTDTAWSAGSGPVVADSTYYGETYDAALEQPGWAAPGFVPPASAPAWLPAAVIADPLTPPTMTSQLMPAIERVALLPALSVTPVAAPGAPRWTYDFGVQLAGRCALAVPPGTPAGSNLTLKHAEVLSHPPFAAYDGSAWMGNLFWANPVDSYITGSSSAEVTTHEPAFTEHGFRYVELSVDPPLAGVALPPLSMLTAVVLRTAAREQGSLALGSPTLQALSRAAWWTESAALMGIPAGTAARGERTGWTGDAAFASESELVDFDTGAFFAQFLQQLQQLQCSDGTVPSCIPNTDPRRDGQPQPLPCSGAEGDPSWGTVYPTVAWGVWKYYGALGLARRHYPSLLSYMAMLERAVNATGLKDIFCTWGDWNPVQRTDCHVTAAATYLHDLLHMQELAAALGEGSDAAAFGARLGAQRADFHAAFWNPALGLYDAGTQVAQAVALWTGVAAGAGVAGNVSAWLAADLLQQGLTFGFIGVRYVYEALALHGQVEAALRSLLGTAAPSYGYELYNEYEPSSNLWESWDAPSHRQWLDESSRSHHYQASIQTFLRKHVAGLDMPSGAAAWSTVTVRPYAALPLPSDLAGALPFAQATVAAHRGLVQVSWARQSSPAGSVAVNATLPSGSEGSVSVPKVRGGGTVCREGGVVVWQGGAFVPGVAGVVAGVEEAEWLTFAVHSGAYQFVAE